jgi:hypothetical protein
LALGPNGAEKAIFYSKLQDGSELNPSFDIFEKKVNMERCKYNKKDIYGFTIIICRSNKKI